MKIGVCGGYKKAIIAKKLGFDYMEENLSRTAEYNEKEFADCVASYERLALPVYSFNGFFPGTLSLYGEDVSEIRQYTELALSRAHVLGGKVCVIGSGKARHIPNGMDDAFCRSRFTDVVAMCADIADRYGMRVVVEPLRRGETNGSTTTRMP